ncbi:MAG: RidA family protein [Robiginitomaculum sp.]|nr:RidA family protein [Robiginitomaculum sp.]
MSEVRRAYSGGLWESKVGYCRAIRHGALVWVTGTTSFDENGTIHAPGDAYAQAVRCLQIIKTALVELDVQMSDIVRTRIFVTDIRDWEAIGRAHLEVFQHHPPTTTMVEVSRLIGPEMRVEIEADAMVSDMKKE